MHPIVSSCKHNLTVLRHYSVYHVNIQTEGRPVVIYTERMFFHESRSVSIVQFSFIIFQDTVLHHSLSKVI
jgi:hypothetical protein